MHFHLCWFFGCSGCIHWSVCSLTSTYVTVLHHQFSFSPSPQLQTYNHHYIELYFFLRLHYLLHLLTKKKKNITEHSINGATALNISVTGRKLREDSYCLYPFFLLYFWLTKIAWTLLPSLVIYLIPSQCENTWHRTRFHIILKHDAC